MKNHFEKHQQDQMTNDPANYKWHLFYFNPRDSRIFVPKRNRMMGWTINFGNIFSYLVLSNVQYLLSYLFY